MTADTPTDPVADVSTDAEAVERELDPEIERFIERIEARSDGSTRAIRTADAKDFGRWLVDRGLTAAEVTTPDIEDYIVDCDRRGYAPPTIKGRRTCLSILFDELEARGYIEDNPMDDFNARRYANILNGTKKGRYVDARGGIFALDPEGIEKLAENVKKPTGRNKLIVLLMYHTGVRVQELCDMKLEHVNRENRSIDVWSKKLDSEFHHADPWRTVWWGPSLDPLMTRWLDFGERDGFYYADESPYIFPTNKSERINEETVREIVVDAAERAGLQEVMYEDADGNERRLITPHTLRHSFARECMQGEYRIDLVNLRDLMGHTSTETTEKYLVFAENDNRHARQLYGPK